MARQLLSILILNLPHAEYDISPGRFTGHLGQRKGRQVSPMRRVLPLVTLKPVSYTHLRAHET